MTKRYQNEQVKRIAQNVLSLPALPTIIAKMIEMIDNPRTSASQLTKLISTDQVLTAKILKLANSAYYGFPRRIGTINLAIVVLGFDTIKDLGLSASIIDRFKRRSGNTSFDMSLFWEHSIACGVIGRRLARELNYRISGEVFVAGLLHDIGKLILNQYFPNELNEIVDRIKKNNESFVQAEIPVIGVGHALIGSWLTEKWNLPSQLVEVIKYHHTPDQAPEQSQIASIVQFADFLCKWRGIGYSGDKVLSELSSETLQSLKVKYKGDKIDMEYYAELVDTELEKAESFITLIQGRPAPERTYV